MALDAGVALRELQRIPGVGPRIAEDLWRLGIRQEVDLRGRDPQALYDHLCVLEGGHVDRCMLYVLRCAVYYASTPEPDPELLKWWRWKEVRAGGGGGVFLAAGPEGGLHAHAEGRWQL